MEHARRIVEAQIRLLNRCRGINEAEQKKVVGNMVLLLQRAMREKSSWTMSRKWGGRKIESGKYPKGKSVPLVFPNTKKPLGWFNLADAKVAAEAARKRAQATTQRKMAEEAALKKRTMERLQRETEQRKRENAEQARKDQLNARIGQDVDGEFRRLRGIPEYEILNRFSTPGKYSAADLINEKKRGRAYKKVMMKYHPDKWARKSLEERVRASQIFMNLSNLRDKNKKKQGDASNPTRR